jgi:hypothetical protein
MFGTVPIGLAKISPSPRQASAQARTHTSALVTLLASAAASVAPPAAVTG